MLLTGPEKRLVVSVTGPQVDDVHVQVLGAAAAGAIAELRLDLWEDPNPSALLALESRPPMLVTDRPVREGGRDSAEDAVRLARLAAAGRGGAEAVDIEISAWQAARDLDFGKAQRLVSHHIFEPGVADVDSEIARLRSAGADAIKLAVMPRDIAESLRLLESQRLIDGPATLIGMGEYGTITRVLGAAYGAGLIYAAADSGDAAAPGQVPVSAMRDLYRFERVAREGVEAWFGVVGDPISHSRSPELHNLAFEHLKLPYCYVPLRTRDLGILLEALEPHPCRGLSVTLPHKEAALRLAAEADEDARRIGAANTLTRRASGGWLAQNTDAPAIVAALGGASALSGRRALVLGAGGVARAAVRALTVSGAEVTVCNRTFERAASLTRDLGGQVVRSVGPDVTEWDVIVNATSLGMSPSVETTPLPDGRFRAGQVVFDTVYAPAETRLLMEAASQGATAVRGTEMFLQQARRQLEIWTGREAPMGAWRSRF
ncbi:MAG: shikimate dehydrogenase [Planctomycetota bacterium]